MNAEAKIISCNSCGEEICASAARISTTLGNAHEIFENARDNEKNRGLIGKVLRSGHKSTLEHAVFTLAMSSVSVFVEQFFIECRLASFTVKSRRYVDFGGLGYHIPPDLEGADREIYCRYMDQLFAAYRDLLELGVPKEDARFLLPYSFHSNFYCTLNARELAHIIRQIRYGRGRGVPELQAIAAQLTMQLAALFPCLLPELEGAGEDPASPDGLESLPDTPVFVSQNQAGAVQLISGPSDPMELLRAACWTARTPFSPEALLRSQRPRELEQLQYSFLISGLSLSGVTHLVRHRMQSVLVPPVGNDGRYILPASIAEAPPALERYTRAVETAHQLTREIRSIPSLCQYHYYFALSGNMLDVMTAMNARELQHFIRLRTCTRAQWEIRGAAISMLRQLRDVFPELFGRFGPSCYLWGSCPEGAMSCGRMEEMARLFGEE